MGAISWLRALSGFFVFGIIWFAGNIILYGGGGVATAMENMSPAYDVGTRQAVFIFWNIILPILVIIALAVYIIVSNQTEAPTQR